jgi:hypothetical protein
MPLWSRKGDLGGLVHHSDAGANTPRSDTPSAWPRPAYAVGRLGRRFLRQRHAESVVGLYTTEVIPRTGPWKGIDASNTRRWSGWTGSTTDACSSRSATPALQVRGRGLEEGGLNGDCSTQRTQPPVNPGWFTPASRTEPPDLARLMVASRRGCVGIYRSAYLDSGNPTDRGGTRVPRTGELKSRPR